MQHMKEKMGLFHQTSEESTPHQPV